MVKFLTEEELQKTFALANDAVYFATPDGQTKYYGFGKQAELIGASFAQVKTWLATLKNDENKPVFGGFAFDKQQIADSKLMNGYFIQPAVVYDVINHEMLGLPIDLVRQTTTFDTNVMQITDETDWPSRIQTAIDDMKQNKQHEKVVLGRQRQVTLSDPLDEQRLLSKLQNSQSTSYHFVLKHCGELFVSATPERLVKVTGGQLSTAAVAGTIKRGADSVSDQALADELWHDSKNRVEHETVVAEIKERLQAANVKSLQVPTEPQILKTPQVQHLYTPITGQLASDSSLLEIAAELHPTPALGGKPRDWALAEIAQIEKMPRGLFSGPIGMMTMDGDGEFIVGIRSMWYRKNLATLFAGAGILAASDAQMEYQETGLKLLPMMNLLKEQINND
ncbi:isochorismate synthase [Weissella paramesenteroides]|jgi:menaquinone-specific isochorismate synthase|uniref:isochorismate synthase n=1 Tax=Weissella paramesenteroides ATCC 33313 TaxID=585506 RepID=C5R8H2_WEIPA|nr:isochorismate synthase [Weissella paramesenteroides]ATF40742.1 isochorismate synthase [Weissella paramesenteroides]EER75466.1 isochorismate synthase [Weissella paramesenteroides ATCC 33313]WEA52517.1 isochorismate synthase [Weissella paramesenteroides]